jgi:hypothetical protein
VQQHANVVCCTADDSGHIRRREVLNLPQLKDLTLLRGEPFEAVVQELPRLSRCDKAVGFDRRLQP